MTNRPFTARATTSRSNLGLSMAMGIVLGTVLMTITGKAAMISIGVAVGALVHVLRTRLTRPKV